MSNKERLMTNEEAIGRIQAHCYFNSLVPETVEALDTAIEALEQKPKTGQWIFIEKTDEYTRWKCSECWMLVKNSQTPWYNYCPTCGAKMEVESEVQEV